jgi:hypothetical protein
VSIEIPSTEAMAVTLTKAEINLRDRAAIAALDCLRMLMKLGVGAYAPYGALAVECAKLAPLDKLLVDQNQAPMDREDQRPIHEVIRARKLSKPVRRLSS